MRLLVSYFHQSGWAAAQSIINNADTIRVMTSPKDWILITPQVITGRGSSFTWEIEGRILNDPRKAGQIVRVGYINTLEGELEGDPVVRSAKVVLMKILWIALFFWSVVALIGIVVYRLLEAIE